MIRLADPPFSRPAVRNGARFYSAVPLCSGLTIDLPPALAHHAMRVLRLRQGDPMILFTGEGGEFDAVLVSSDKREARVTVGAWYDIERESPLSVTLAQALSTSDKMDFTLQKAVELGAVALTPITTAKGIIQLDDQRAQKRLEHWRQVVISACEQCGRNRIPLISAPVDLHTFLSANTTPTRIVLTPRASQSVGKLVLDAAPILLLAGPEGGLTLEEERAAVIAGFTAVGLGPRILRTETAAVVALAALQARYGDL